MHVPSISEINMRPLSTDQKNGKPIYQEKSAERAKIAADVEAYLAKGGDIYQATSADNSGNTVNFPRTRSQMIADQKALHSRLIMRDKERKAARKS